MVRHRHLAPGNMVGDSLFIVLSPYAQLKRFGSETNSDTQARSDYRQHRNYVQHYLNIATINHFLSLLTSDSETLICGDIIGTKSK